MKTEDLNDLLEGGNATLESNNHFLILALVFILYSVSVLVHYLLYKDEDNQYQTIYNLFMSELDRLFKFRLVILEGIYNRLKERPQIIAENKVQAYKTDLQAKSWKLQKELKKLRGQRAYELTALELARKRVDAVIDSLYGDQK